MSMMIVSSEEFEEECLSLGIKRDRQQGNDSSSKIESHNLDSNSNFSNNSLLDSGSENNQIPSSESAPEYNSTSNSIPPIIQDPTPLGRGLGSIETPSSVRKVIAQESITGTSAKVIQETFGISQSSISAYKKGATSTATINRPDAELQEHNNKIREKISRSARNRLILALKHITPDKLESAKVRDAASVAKDMSVIVRNMNEQLESSIQNNVQFIIHRPRMRSIEDFDVIESNE